MNTGRCWIRLPNLCLRGALILLVLPINSVYATACGPGSSIVPRSQVADAVVGLKDPLVFMLKTDEKQTIGNVTVTNINEDGEDKWLMYYKITANDWYLADIKLAIATSLFGIIHTNNNQPDVDQFAYQFKMNSPKKEFTISISLRDKNIAGDFLNVCDQVLVLSSQITLTSLANGDDDMDVTTDNTAWVDGDKTNDIVKYAIVDFPCLPCEALSSKK